MVTYYDFHTAMKELGWDIENDDIVLEIGGTQVSGIDQPEGYNKKWSSPLGHRKYNKDAFIVLKNLSRNDDTKSQPMDREHKPQHPYTPVGEQQKQQETDDIIVNMEGGVGGSWEVKEEG